MNNEAQGKEVWIA